MSDIQDQILFAGSGLDTDRDYRYADKGDSPYRLNILISEDGEYGVITNLLGNKKVVYFPPTKYPLLGCNVYFTLGSCYDALTRNVYYWIFSQPVDTTGSGDYLYDNRLLRFNEDTEIIDTIFVDQYNYFGLNPTKVLRDPFVLSGWIYFNPRTSEPKIIDILRAYNYTNYDEYDITATYVVGNKVTYMGGLFVAIAAIAAGETPVTASAKWDRIGDSYQNLTDLEFDSEFEYAFNVIKHIPVYRPTCIYASDADKSANNVRGKLFRFSHRYKYFDNTYSRYGAFSDITLPQNDEEYNGEVPNDIAQYNCIDVQIRLHSPALIKEIDIVFQEVGGDWKRAKIINRQDIELLDQAYYIYRFYNTDSAYEHVDDTVFNEAYDSVPRTAECQEIINKNILCYGYCKEGFDNIPKEDIDVSLTPIPEAITIPDTVWVIRRDCVSGGDITYPDTGMGRIGIEIDLNNAFAGGVAQDDIFKVTINSITKQHILLLADVANIGDFTIAITTYLGTDFPTVDWTADIANGLITADFCPPVTEFYFYDTGIAEATVIKKRGFKTGAWHPFCIFYYDEAMRRWDAQTSKDLPEGTNAWEILGTSVYVPMITEYSPPLGVANKWNIDWEVNHMPPIGAKWWRWGYAANALCSYFVQYIINDIDDVGAVSTTEPINTTWVDISPLQTLRNSTEGLWNKFPNSIINPYQWQKGDRVRFITEKSVANDIGATLDGIYDYEILSFDEDTHRLYIQVINHAALDIDADSLIEIYRPVKTDTAIIFFEFGELMPIITDSSGELVHGSGFVGTQDQDSGLGLPATGTFENGDVYHILRTPSKPIDTVESYFHESQWYSDFYESDDWDKGRIGVETSFGERDLNIIRYSNQYLQNTLINGLATFEGKNYKELNDIYGKLLRIIEIGDTLKFYQRKKPGSILIGRTEYVDAEGNANIVQTSERILGAIRYSLTNYGSEFPESILRNNRYVYGFDVYNGVLWRDSANGIYPISGKYEATDGTADFRMETYFRNKAKDLLVSGIDHVSVMTVWDEKFKNLYVIFNDLVNLDNNDVVMFHEPSNRWIGFSEMGYTPPNGWNQILELTYEVVRGFENGIGFEFDDETRFAIFDIETGSGVEILDPAYTYITDEDGTTYLISELGTEYIIE